MDTIDIDSFHQVCQPRRWGKWRDKFPGQKLKRSLQEVVQGSADLAAILPANPLLSPFGPGRLSPFMFICPCLCNPAGFSFSLGHPLVSRQELIPCAGLGVQGQWAMGRRKPFLQRVPHICLPCTAVAPGLQSTCDMDVLSPQVWHRVLSRA